MTGGVSGLIVGGACVGLLMLSLAIWARRVRRRTESMTKPLHELRGALGALDLGLATNQRVTRSRSGLESYIEALRVPLERATLAVEDLDACRLGQPTPNVTDAERVELASLVLLRARAWSRLAPSYESRLRIDWRAGPVHVRGDAGRLKQALDNLIANALEHGGGRVLVEGSVRGNHIHVAISDGGPGPRRLSGRRRGLRASPQRGHGLSIAKEVVEAHGGRLALGAGRNGAAIVVELPAESQLGARRPQRLSSIAPPARPGSHAPNAA